MAIGPVQLIVLGFEHPEFHGEIVAELERLKETGTVARHRRARRAQGRRRRDRGPAPQHPRPDEAIELGSMVGALSVSASRARTAWSPGPRRARAAGADGVSVFSDDDAWDVIAEIPNDSAAALILLEHHWAVPLRDAVARAGGSRISDGFISPLDLVEIGLVSAEEARELHAAEIAGKSA